MKLSNMLLLSMTAFFTGFSVASLMLHKGDINIIMIVNAVIPMCVWGFFMITYSKEQTNDSVENETKKD